MCIISVLYPPLGSLLLFITHFPLCTLQTRKQEVTIMARIPQNTCFTWLIEKQ